MKTECKAKPLDIEGMGRRRVVASFDGNHVSSDGGLLLLHELNQRTGFFAAFAACFLDYRDPHRIEHTVEHIVAQRVLGIVCGNEDLNDHETLRKDPLFAAVVGKTDIEGKKRRSSRDTGLALPSPSTLNRLELTPATADASSRYCKIVCDESAIDDFFVQRFLNAHRTPPESIVLDLDATDDPLHGQQEYGLFHGYYKHHCYLPLYIFCGDFLLCSRLRPSNIDASAGSIEELERIVAGIRERWPNVQITLRADSGFARDSIMSWAEKNGIDFVFGLSQNKRLLKMIEDEMEEVKAECEATGVAVRQFCELRYQTRNSWSNERRVVAKAEHIPDKANPRFVVTTLDKDAVDAKTLYEKVYCARGDMENRIKEQQLDLFADRTSAYTMRANQIRLYFASVAYVLLNELRLFGLRGTEMARAQAGTIRTKLIKIGAVVTTSVRRVVVKLSRYAPVQQLFCTILDNLRRRLPAPG